MNSLFSKLLKKCRKSQGFTQKDVSDMTGIPLTAYPQYENGTRAIPSKVYKILENALDLGIYGNEYRKELQKKVVSLLNTASLQQLVNLERKIDLLKVKAEDE